MSFLESFDPDQRTLFAGAAERLNLARSEYLLRRGEPGGDVYLVEHGSLEVVDSRSVPEVIVATMETGAVVGEMAFVDDSPRSIDVRAASDSVILRWARDDLRSLLARHPDLAATFYQVVCKVATARIRRLTEGAVRGGFQRAESVTQEGLQRLREEARAVAEHVKSRFLEVETLLRANAADQAAVAQVRGELDALEGRVHDLFTDHPEPEAGEIASEILCRELHPYLVRSALAERCIRKPQGVTGTAEIMAHVLVDTAGGDGLLGEVLDRWLLDRPTLHAMRAFREPTLSLVAKHLPAHRNRRVLLLNAGTGSLANGLCEVLAATPTVLTVVDQSRDALAFLGATAIARKGIELQTVQENLAQFALGRSRHRIPEQDAIVVHGLFEYLPDRIGVSLIQHCRSLLREDGVLVVSALGPSRDRELLDRLLSWPTLRRTQDGLERILRAGGMVPGEFAPMAEPGIALSALPDALYRGTPGPAARR